MFTFKKLQPVNFDFSFIQTDNSCFKNDLNFNELSVLLPII